jgi:hypothetical protein
MPRVSVVAECLANFSANDPTSFRIHSEFIQISLGIHRDMLSSDRDGGERLWDREKRRGISDKESGKRLARENKRVSTFVKGTSAQYKDVPCGG